MAKNQANYPGSLDVLNVDRQAGALVTSNSYDIIEDAITEIEAEMRRVTAKTTTGTLTTSEGGLVSCSATGAYTLTLPASTGNIGLGYFFIKTDNNSNAITLKASTGNSEKINGSATYTNLNSQWDWVWLKSDRSSTGNNWAIVSEKVTPSGIGALESSGSFTVKAIPQISSTGGVLKASVFQVTTGNVFNFGAHSAGFTEQAIATTTGTANINWNNGIKALFTRSTASNGAMTFTFTAPAKSVNCQLTIRGSTAGCTGVVTWPAIKWSTDKPTLSTGASAIDVVSLSYSTGLTLYLGVGSLNFSS